MSYLKKLFSSLKEIILTYILSYILIIAACLIYTLLGYNNLTSFINNICSYLILIFYIIITTYLYLHNKKKELPLRKKSYFPIISLGISLAVFLNMIIFKLNGSTTVTTSIPYLLVLISSGIIGPIYEEILFRYLFLNRLKKFHSVKKSIFINSLIFALIHLSPIKIIYAFFLGLVLNITYEKYKNILAPILLHISANTIVLYLTDYNSDILILSFINIIIAIYINFKK